MKFLHIATVAMISAVSTRDVQHRVIVQAEPEKTSTEKKPEGDMEKKKEDGNFLMGLFGKPASAVTIGATATSVALTAALYM